MKSNLGLVGDQDDTPPAVAQPRTSSFSAAATWADGSYNHHAVQMLPCSGQAAAASLARIRGLASGGMPSEALRQAESTDDDRHQGTHVGSLRQESLTQAELRAFNAGRAFAERIARAEQNARRRDLCQMALHGLADEGVSQEAVLHRIVAMIYPDLADLADQDPALARRALNALQPD